MDKEKNFVSAVVYVHNAEHKVSDFVNTVIAVLTSNFEHSEVICVNDFSSDRSLEQIRAINAEPAALSLSVINMSYYHGVEMAMNAGTDIAIGDFVFEFDDTILDFAPETIMQVYRKALEGNDIVSASPDKGLRITSKLFYNTFEQFLCQGCGIKACFRVLSSLP